MVCASSNRQGEWQWCSGGQAVAAGERSWRVLFLNKSKVHWSNFNEIYFAQNVTVTQKDKSTILKSSVHCAMITMEFTINSISLKSWVKNKPDLALCPYRVGNRRKIKNVRIPGVTWYFQQLFVRLFYWFFGYIDLKIISHKSTKISKIWRKVSRKYNWNNP